MTNTTPTTEDKKIHDVAIIGGGAAGVMAYLRCVLNCDQSILFMGDSKAVKSARGTWVSEVDNMPGFHGMRNPITQSNKKTLTWIKEHPDLSKYGTALRSSATHIQKNSDDTFLIQYEDKTLGTQTVYAQHIILATGVMDVQPIIQRSIDPILPYGNRNDVLYCLRCDGHRVIGHDLSIIGNNESAIYIAAILKERYNNTKIMILSHGKNIELSKEAQGLVKVYNMEIHPEEITAVLGDPKNEGLQGYMLGDKILDTTRSVVALGTKVYNDLAKKLKINLSDNGRIPTYENYETNVRNVFAIGDILDHKKMQIYTAWDESVDAADEINKRIRAKKRQKAMGIN